MTVYQKVNNLTGWAVFAIAAATYTSTVEPTSSFWDCGEFIASSYKLMVQHPPGAPFFLLLGRMFSFLAGSDVTQVAYWVNILSALCSAFAILFLFWTITRIGQTVLSVTNEPALPQTIGLMVAGTVGSLAYAFSDSFWFSAVEAEVYAMSSLFTAFVVWAMLKWERITDESAANRWLILIAYTVGLSIGTHLLNLVTLPALAFIYYFKRYKPTFWGGVLTFGIGLSLIGVLMTGVRTGLLNAAGKFDLFFVNTIGLPFGSGVAVFGLLLVVALVAGIQYSVRTNHIKLNTALLSLVFVLIGYSSYLLIVIRANDRPPINLNNPDNAVSFMDYLNLKQYPTRPLLYGPYFTARLIDQKKGTPNYVQGKERYEQYGNEVENIYEPGQQTLFPRMYSQDQSRNHPELYHQITGLRPGQQPTMAHNLEFLFKHQLGTMYWRYFLWNFVGRDSDEDDAGWRELLTPFKQLPPDLTQNKGHNRLYALPLLLGLIGLVFQYRRNRQSLLFVGLLFLLTGVALVLYLNSPPSEPRARDYIYVGSYYAFAIWIGLGALAVTDFVSRYVKKQLLAPGLAGLLCLLVPTLLATQNWDDHNRSGRYFAVDSARNMLNSCAPNAILFTNGDNDTYPLWYAQNVEGVRRDVRVCVVQFMGSDWYIDQLKRQEYESAPLPILLKRENYIANVNNQIAYVENPRLKEGIQLDQYLKLLRENSPALQVALQDGGTINVLPARRLILPVNKPDVLAKGIIPRKLEPLLDDSMEIEPTGGDLFKSDLVFLDILTNNHWERPVYFTSLFTPAQFNLQEYTQVEGMVYRLLPVKVAGAKQGFVNAEIAYQNLMEKCNWRGLNNSAVYHDATHRLYVTNWGRFSFWQTATQLLEENETEKARKALLRALALMPDKSIPYDRICSLYVAPLLQVGETGRAMEIAQTMATRADENLTYYLNQPSQNASKIQSDLFVLNQLATALKQENHPQASRYAALFNKHYQKLE